MKEFKLKNKIISIFGIIAILGACCASIFSGLFISENKNSRPGEDRTYAYDVNEYTPYADSVVSQISNANLTSLPTTYSLKDEYPVLAENQTDSKLCWVYSGSKVLETTLMHAKGEYYNFSEMAVAYFAYLAGTNAAINDYGNFQEYDLTIRNQGIVLESDFSNDIYTQINENNHEVFSYVTDLADKNVATEVVPIFLSNNDNFSNSNNKERIIKYYIQNIGGLNIALPANSMFIEDAYTGEKVFTYGITSSNEGKSIYENHAVCLIGWNESGFIGLNSWGVDDTESYEEVIIPYDVMDKYYRDEILFQGQVNNDWLCGYYYVGGEDVSINSSTASVFSSTIVENASNPIKNIFCYTEQITIVYAVDNISNFDMVYANIYKGTQDVTSTFAISYDEENDYITISWQPSTSNFLASVDNKTFFAGGTYSVRIYEDINLISTESIVVYTGTEMSYFKFSCNTSATDGTYYGNMNNMASSSSDYTYYVNHSSGYQLDLYMTEISKLSNVSGVSDFDMFVYTDFAVYDEETEKYEKEALSSSLYYVGNNSQSKNCYTFELAITSDYAGKLVKYQIDFYSPYYSNVIHHYTFKVYVSSVTDASAKNNAYNVIYVMNGGKNSDKNVDIYPQYTKDSMTTISLFNPIHVVDAYEFQGWYTTPTFEEESVVSLIDSNISGTLVLYAKWGYNDTLYYTTGLTVGNVYNYKQETMDISGVDFSTKAELVYGESIGLKATFNITDELKAKTFSLKYYFYVNGTQVKEVELITTNDMGNVQSSYEVLLGGRGDAYLAFPNLTVGEYVAEVVAVVAIKHEFSVTESAFYEINVSPKQVEMVYDAEASTVTYDKQGHLPVVSFDRTSYYLEDINDFRTVSFNEPAKVSSGTYEFTVQNITNSNYVLNPEALSQIYRLCINTRKVTITWSDLSAVYNGKAKKPTATVVGFLTGDNVSVTLEGPTAIDVGTYTFTASTSSLSNTNYTVQTETKEFTITPASLTVRFNPVEERAQKSAAYRTQISFSVEGTLYDSVDELGITCDSLGLTSTTAGEYPITGESSNSNYDITFITEFYVLTGYYYITYMLPDGEIYKELVNYGETPKGITDDIYEVSFLQRIKYDQELVETGDDMYIKVTVVDYTWYVVIGAAIVGFVALYFIVSRKARRNKVR